MPGKFFPLTRGFAVTSGFGERVRNGQRETHWGTDFGRAGGSGGNPVHAVQGGRVDRAGPADGFGQWVCVDHPAADGGGYSVYGHVIPEVSVGQRVEAGQRIARVNPTKGPGNGWADPHCHLEIHRYLWSWPGPDRLDPLPWLGDAQYPGEAVAVAPPSTPGGDVTQFGIDVSNHQGNFDFAQARAEGFVFATHKICEGTWRDPYWTRALDEMRKHFPGRFGGYVFCKVATNPDTEADVVAAMCPTDVPIQIDYEDLDDNGSIGDLWARINALTARGFRLLPIYLPRWYWQGRMGSPDLSGLPVPIWNSHYVTGSGFASSLYPGDMHPGWAPMGGKDVAILQFTEQATVAGQRIDANAVRGADTLAAIFGGGGEELDMGAVQEIKDYIDIRVTGPIGSDVKDIREQLCGAGQRDAGQYGGWPQLGDEETSARTVVDGQAEALSLLRSIEKRLAALEAKES